MLGAWAVVGTMLGHAAGAGNLASLLTEELTAPRVGEWATYEISAEGARASFLRIAVVSEERDNADRDAVWVEVEVGEDPGLAAPLAQMRMLVTKKLATGSSGITRLFVSQGFEKPQEVGPDALSRFLSPHGQRPTAPPKATWVRTGERAWVMTPAGSVAATPVDVMHESSVIRRTWRSASIPVLHIAKMEMPLIHHQMVVREFGTQARSRMVLPSSSDPKIHLAR